MQHESDRQLFATPPRLTIGLPVYNGARFLREALDSLIRQTFEDFELIVSDNASTDETSEIVGEHAQKDARVRLIRHSTNRGAAWNYNFVFGETQSQYFKWAAADDVCAPTYLEKCIDALDADPTLVCCHSRTRKIDEAGCIIEPSDDPTDGGLPTSWFADGEARCHRPDASSQRPARRFADVLLSSGWAVRCSGVMRSEALRYTSLIKSIYGSEKITMGELALRGRFRDLEETLFFQRVHEQASGELASVAAQRKFVGGKGGRAALLRGHLRALRQAPISFSQRAACWWCVARYLMQFHKWSGIVRSNLYGRGVVGSRTYARDRCVASSRGRHWTELCSLGLGRTRRECVVVSSQSSTS